MASPISQNLDDTVMSTLASELSDPNRSMPSQTGVPTRRLTQATLDNFLASWSAALVTAGMQAPTPSTTDNAASGEPTNEAPPV